MEQEIINLLEFTTNAGCSCKIAPQRLQEILKINNGFVDSNILIGNSTSDDAAVYAIDDENCIISTTDFFTPIHNDAYTYGSIAASNAISDVYAMGGRPIMATAILAWPTEKLSDTIAQQVLQGASDICKEAGMALAGGHSVMAAEPLFGLNVTGIIKKEAIKKNNTAQEGDLLFITKPIGLGMLTSAMKRNALLTEHEGIAENIMLRLNKLGTVLSTVEGVTAMTDITGFGLAGHIIEMCDKERLSVELNWSAIPLATDLSHYVKNRILPDATFRNWQAYGTKVGFGTGVPVMDAFNILPDPQTSGGLCFAVNPNTVGQIQQLLTENNLSEFVNPIGKFIAAGEKTIMVNL